MRILHVNDFLPDSNAGAEVYLGRLIAAQRARGDNVDVTAATPDPSRRPNPALDIWNGRERSHLRDVVRRLRPDVVHAHNVARELSPSVLGATDDVPVVMTVHDLRAFGGYEHSPMSLRGIAERLVVSPVLRREIHRHVDHFIAVSDAVAADVRAARFGPVTTVTVPVADPVATLQQPSASSDVVFVGRLSTDKGVFVLLEAFEKLQSQISTARLLFAGDGPERDELQRRASPLGDSVCLLGRLDQSGVSQLLATARAVAVPSLPSLRREGAPLAAAEAARHGRPVVGSDDPGLAEVVRGVDGVVVPAGDADALAHALHELLTDDVAADRMGAEATVRAKARHDPATVAAQVSDVYERVLTGTPPKHS